jgi:hypothetical protein
MRIVCRASLIFVLACASAQAATRNVFFAGGQSNAKAVWAAAIASGLQSGYGSSLVMVHTNHSGEPLANWFTTEAKANYSNDLFNAAGTGLLQTQIRAITNAGDHAVFQGFFWFQGESDTGSAATMEAYTNRFKAMMAQLKGDLGLTNDVRFAFAIIDANPSPDFDDDLAASGRTREMVDTLRTNQINLCSTPPGAYVDTRGYTRTDLWHLTTDELTRLGGNLSTAFTNKFGTSLPPSVSVDVFSHTADGAIYSTGTFVDQTLICGVAGSVMYNGIAFFQLPTNRIGSANLTLTVDTNSGPLTNANIDVWGLGYMTVPYMSSAWTLAADTDARALINANVPFTKLADNIVTAGQATAVGSAWSFSPAQGSNLTAFLNGLYEKGAQPGDYAVLRVNPDAAFTAVQNVRFGSSSQVSPDRRPKLTLTLSDASALAATECAFLSYSHANDGGVYATGTSTANDLISGTGGTGTQDYNGIAFFPLPEQPLTSASLSLPAVTFSGVMPSANIDVWLLGYQSAPALTTAWYCTNDVGNGVATNAFPPVKLADNIVTAGQTYASGNVWQPNKPQKEKLRQYLNGLYLKGAKPGDYAILRVNMDNRQWGVNCGVRWGGSQQALPANRASLSGVYPLTTNVLSNPGFELGSGPVATGWVVSYNNFLGQRTNASPRSGSFSYRFAVGGDQSTNAANNINISQDVTIPGVAGRCVTFSFYARHNSGEPMISNSNQKVEARLWWLNGASLLGFVDGTWPLVPTDPRETNRLVLVSGVAPTNATGVKPMIIFRTGTGTGYNPAITNGAALVDDLRLTILQPDYPEGTLLWVQ